MIDDDMPMLVTASWTDGGTLVGKGDGLPVSIRCALRFRIQ